MRIEHGDRVVRPHLQPTLQIAGVTPIQRVEHERWQREVVHAIHLAGDGKLILVMPVHLDEHLHAAPSRLRRQPGNEIERLGNHEAARSRAFHRMPYRVEPDHRDAGVLKAGEHGRQVALCFRMRHVEVDLIVREGGPEHH